MNTLKVKLIAFPGAPDEIISRGEQIIKNKLSDFNIEISNQDPDALFIITGGSENQSKKIIDDRKQILILAMTEGNSYAAATEIKAYCNQNKIDSILYNIDNEHSLQDKLNYYLRSSKTLSKLKNYKIGLIGEVSEWLIASDIENKTLNNKFGIQLEKIAWDSFPKYSEYPVNTEFVNHFENSGFNLEDSSKVFNLLKDIIKQRQVDAITVECFPLVVENAVTACLALSKLNTEGFASGCEGDITSIVGKVIVKELTDQIPWMANTAALEEDKIFYAHCTIATDLVSDYKINTHFETNKGTAVQGKFKAENATIFRLNNELSKAFVSYGNIVERPEREDSCRTQIKIEIPQSDITKLKENPLGNHHLLIPGNHVELLKYFCKLTGIELI
jgi:L-fucose isomerase-like protein